MEKDVNVFTNKEEVVSGLECGNPALFFYMTRYQQRLVVLLAITLAKAKNGGFNGKDIKLSCSSTRLFKIMNNNSGFSQEKKERFYGGLEELKSIKILDVIILKDYKLDSENRTMDFVISKEAYEAIFAHLVKYSYEILVSFLNMSQKHAGMILYMLLNSNPSENMVIHHHNLNKYCMYKEGIEGYTKFYKVMEMIVNPSMHEINEKTCFNLYLNIIDDINGKYLEFRLRKKVYSNGEEMPIPLRDELDSFMKTASVSEERLFKTIEFKM